MARRRDAGPWAGVDVGGPAKGFHVAVIHPNLYVCGPRRFSAPQAVKEWLRTHSPTVVAIDSPCEPAPDGDKSRGSEGLFRDADICQIRGTPDRATMAGNATGYYGWVLNGLELWDELRTERGWTLIECFPTATWTQIGTKRGKRSRAAWSTGVLSEIGLHGVRGRLSQDDRDALGAAQTARLDSRGECEAFGDIVVPLPRSSS